MLRWMQCAIAVLLIVAAGPASSAEPTLKLYYFSTSRGVGIGHATLDFIKRVNEKGKGLVQIASPLVDPASIPARQAGNAVKNGIVDMVVAPPGYFAGLAPGVEGMTSNNVTPAEQRKNGAYELINAYFEKHANVHYLGQLGYGTKFHIFTTVPVRTLADFKGMRLRSSRTYKAFFAALGAQPVLISRGETFTAIQRGVVKGYGNLIVEIKQAGWAGVTKYRIDPGFYDALVVLLINKKTWDSLDAKQKAVLSEAAVWLEQVRNNGVDQDTEAQAKELKAGGMQVIMLPPDQAKTFVDLANTATWKSVVKEAPEFGPALKKLILH
jgi:TRAP-type C4-dicarboxylate transport system substrate-binding protein